MAKLDEEALAENEYDENYEEEEGPDEILNDELKKIH